MANFITPDPAEGNSGSTPGKKPFPWTAVISSIGTVFGILQATNVDIGVLSKEDAEHARQLANVVLNGLTKQDT